jgi:hypothetical protein
VLQAGITCSSCFAHDMYNNIYMKKINKNINVFYIHSHLPFHFYLCIFLLCLNFFTYMIVDGNVQFTHVFFVEIFLSYFEVPFMLHGGDHG